MLDQQTESYFEALIVSELTTERLGWVGGSTAQYDRDLGLYPQDAIAFLRATHAKKWDRLVKVAGSEEAASTRLLKRLASQLDARGSIAVLRDGFLEASMKFKPFQAPPAHGLDPATEVLYAANVLRVVRQVYFDAASTQSIDLVLFVNGIPTATAELKNRWTRQNFDQAIHQYKHDRDPTNVLLGRRAFVHFAADADEVWMTTRLAWKATRFLPFNQGSNGPGEPGGRGNPVSPDGHATSYLWEQVWERDAWLALIQRFVHVQPPADDAPRGTQPLTIFPRYHQLDVVRRCAASACALGPGRNYLIQHSAGSGKTNEIAWLAHELSALYDAAEEKVFDKVVVITDRRVLDRQLQDQIEQFEQTDGVVQSITGTSTQLRDALLSDTVKIVVSTLQKFPFLLKALEGDQALKSGRYAVIVDEAHSSQTGEAAAALKEGIGSITAADIDLDEEDDGTPVELLRRLAARQPQPNLSFFAFTATPKGKTLSLFGEQSPDAGNNPRAFHTYSMRQAIEEGFIVDVLRNVTTYQQYYEVETAAGENLEMDSRQGSRRIARFVSLHPYLKEQKAEVVIRHYLDVVRPLLGGKGKAMVVCSSREDAVQWKIAMDTYIHKAKVQDVRVLAAFSGEVQISHTEALNRGAKWTEPAINASENRGRPLAESELPKLFDRDAFGILVVAEKYQTGFDQPKLCGMYVDKRLSGVNAVQTLSRLNRSYSGKSEVYVLDFENTAEGLREAFEPYYGRTEAVPLDPNALDDAQQTLMDRHVITEADVTAFMAAIVRAGELSTASEAERKRIHGLLSVATNASYDRARGLRGEGEATSEGYDAFVDDATRFERYYAFLSSVLPYVAPRTHTLYELVRVLLPRLRDQQRTTIEELPLKLTGYKLQETGSERVTLGHEDVGPLRGFDAGGGRRAEFTKSALEELVEAFNARYRQMLGEGEEIDEIQVASVLRAVGERITQEDHDRLRAQARSNDREDFVRGRDGVVVTAVLDEAHDVSHQTAFLKALTDSDEMLDRVTRTIFGAMWDTFRQGEAA
jgi:type I restriction enzyme R subunit